MLSPTLLVRDTADNTETSFNFSNVKSRKCHALQSKYAKTNYNDTTSIQTF